MGYWAVFTYWRHWACWLTTGLCFSMQTIHFVPLQFVSMHHARVRRALTIIISMPEAEADVIPKDVIPHSKRSNLFLFIWNLEIY